MGSRSRTRQSSTQSLNAESRANINRGQSNIRGLMSANPFQTYTGDFAAGLNDTQLGARDVLAQNMGQGNGLMSEAADMARNAGGFSPENISRFMNPHQDEVIAAAANDINRQRDVALNDNSAAAASAGAWGGSRHGVIDAETNRAGIDALGRTSALLRSQGFNTAAGLASEDASRRLQAAGLMGQLGGAIGSENRANAGLMGQFGSEQNAIDTANLLGQYGEFTRGYDDVYRRIGAEGMATGLMPALVNSQGTTTQSQQPGAAQIIGTGAQILSMFSDRRLKADIKPIGEHKGHKWYEFRYTWDNPSVRRIGVMAQDLIKTNPERVSLDVSGFYKVNYEGLV